MRELNIHQKMLVKMHLRKVIEIMDPAPDGQYVDVQIAAVTQGALHVEYKHRDYLEIREALREAPNFDEQSRAAAKMARHEEQYKDRLNNMGIDLNTPSNTQKWHVWVEGYAATGESAPAQYLGEYAAPSFVDAARAASQEKFPASNELFKIGSDGIPRHWGCRMFDNEADARRSFG